MSLKWNAIRVEVPIAEDETAFEDLPDDCDGKTGGKPENIPRRSLSDRLCDMWEWCSDEIFAKFECAVESYWGPVTERSFYKDTTFVIWTIDSYARKCFPLVFLILQILYWTSYLYVL